MLNKNKNKAKKSGKSTLTIVQEILGVIGGIVGSIMVIYGFIKTFRDDVSGFTWLLFLGGAIWLYVIWQMFQMQKVYAYIFLAVTVVGGVSGWVGWQGQVQAKGDKLIVLIAEFDGPEEVYGLRNEIIESLSKDFGNNDDVEIQTVNEIITPESDSGSARARQLGDKHQADVVIWGWYRPTENPNVNIHIENLSAKQLEVYYPFDESSTYQPETTLKDLDRLLFSRKSGTKPIL
ncbi:MAG: hypothetical protein IPO22_14800 [Anaerolineales bacterium]|nr:hypothetical protein [Anaerolineales bacterium]